MMEAVSSPAIALAPGEGERISFRGVEIVFKSPAKGEAGWTVLDYTLPAGQFGAPLHYHRELVESFYVLEGEIWFRLGDRELIAGPGSFLLAGPGTLHSFANRSSAPARFLAHASDARHKNFLIELLRLAQSATEWPPSDPSKIAALGQRYDTIYVQ